jgi:hypothetical protein
MGKTGRVELSSYFCVIIVSDPITRLVKQVVFVYRLTCNEYLQVLNGSCQVPILPALVASTVVTFKIFVRYLLSNLPS